MFKLIGKKIFTKYSQFYALKVCLSKPVNNSQNSTHPAAWSTCHGEFSSPDTSEQIKISTKRYVEGTQKNRLYSKKKNDLTDG